MISALLIGLLILFLFLRIPVSMATGLAAIIAILASGQDLLTIPQHMVSSVQSVPLLAVPFFIFAAQLMNALGITRQIFGFADAVVGWMRGGLAHANVVAGVIFSGISGAAVADAAALGAISMKAMPAAGYSRAFAGATVMAAATLGPIIPPSIMMIIYALLADVSIARLFIAGLLPGFLIAAILMVGISFLARTGRVTVPEPLPFSGARLWQATREAFLALLAPIVILRGMATGLTTPTEAGVIAVVYALFLGAFRRQLTFKILASTLRETVEATALIMYIIAISSSLTWIFVIEGTVQLMTELLLGITSSPLLFLLIVNALLLVVGCVLETLPAMLIMIPILLPTAKALGIDLVHFGVVIIFNLVIGIITPPVGIGLYIIMAISTVKFGELVRAALPFIFILLGALLILTAVPQITLFLPDLLMGAAKY